MFELEFILQKNVIITLAVLGAILVTFTSLFKIKNKILYKFIVVLGYLISTMSLLIFIIKGFILSKFHSINF
ncbi:MAG: hypothetical protein CL925_02905 [Deltaproteobacteria bacterium]|nr:hypothetical protein [Deltaproteobacteria bacterium]